MVSLDRWPIGGSQLIRIDKTRASSAYRRRESAFSFSSYPLVRSTLSNMLYGRRWRSSLVGREIFNFSLVVRR